jgi:hypothetical protein
MSVTEGPLLIPGAGPAGSFVQVIVEMKRIAINPANNNFIILLITWQSLLLSGYPGLFPSFSHGLLRFSSPSATMCHGLQVLLQYSNYDVIAAEKEYNNSRTGSADPDDRMT